MAEKCKHNISTWSRGLDLDVVHVLCCVEVVLVSKSIGLTNEDSRAAPTDTTTATTLADVRQKGSSREYLPHTVLAP